MHAKKCLQEKTQTYLKSKDTGDENHVFLKEKRIRILQRKKQG
jgi:hypothetical protein